MTLDLTEKEAKVLLTILTIDLRAAFDDRQIEAAARSIVRKLKKEKPTGDLA